MTRMFINKDGQVYSGEAPAAPEDIEQLNPDNYMQQALTAEAQQPIDANAEAIRLKRMDPEYVALYTGGSTPPVPGSAVYPDEITYEGPPVGSMAALELKEDVKRLQEVEKVVEQRKAELGGGTSGTTPSPLYPLPQKSRAEQLAAEARAKSVQPPVV